MIFADRVVEECATLVQCPASDDIAGQKITRAAQIILGQVLRERSEFLRVRSSHNQVWHRGSHDFMFFKEVENL
jgi:hypothetical protein